MTSDWKRAPRQGDPGLLAILKIEHDECELSGATGDLHLHHVIFRSQGGDDVRGNIICLSQALHEAYHQRSDPLVRKALAAHVRFVRTDIWEYLILKLDEGGAEAWLRRHLTI